MNLNDAVEAAVDQCIEEGVLTEYLRRQRAEVCEMFLTEYDEADERRRLENEVRIAKEHAQEQGHRQGFEEGRQQGLEEGLEEGRQQGLEEGLEQGLERGLQKGIEQGLEQGLQQGLEQGQRLFAVRAAEAVRSGSLTLAKAAQLFGLDEEEISAQLGE